MKRMPVVLAVPRRPAPVTLRVRHEFDRRSHELDPTGYLAWVKRVMADQIAERLVEDSQMLLQQMLDRRESVLELEVTVNDRGTYENWLPIERREGRDEGRQEARKALPYGIEEAVHE